MKVHKGLGGETPHTHTHTHIVVYVCIHTHTHRNRPITTISKKRNIPSCLPQDIFIIAKILRKWIGNLLNLNVNWLHAYIHTYIYTFHRSLRVTKQYEVEHVINIQTIKILQCKMHLHSHIVSNTYHLYIQKIHPQSKRSVNLKTFLGLL